MAHLEHLNVVRAGPEAVRAWRDANRGSTFDLSGAVLSNLLLARLDLTQSDLTGADLSESLLEKSNLSQAKLDRACLAGCDFLDADLIMTSLDDADLRGAKLDNTTLHDSTLRRAKMNGASLWHAILHGAQLPQADLEGAKLYQADLSDCDLRGVNLDHAIMENTNLGGANLQGARGLESVRHLGESIVDMRTLVRSGPLPIEFLRGCGVPEEYLGSSGSTVSFTDAEVRDAIRQGEGQTIEFKSSFAETNDAIEALNAFAHADGGTVLFGIASDGAIVGVTLGANTLDNFSNDIRRHTDPLLPVRVLTTEVNDRTVAAARVSKAGPGELYHAFSRAWLRIGSSNQSMSPAEQRARLLAGERRYNDERDRPRFAVRLFSLTSTETGFAPQFSVRHFSGEDVAEIGWRIRGPRFAMPWRQTSAALLEITQFTSTFDISRSVANDAEVDQDEMGFELRFYWQDRWRHELHRWPLTRREVGNRAQWDVGEEIQPPRYD